MKKSIRDRIKSATSNEELSAIMDEASDLRYARPATERRIKKAYQQRRKELK